MLGDFGGVFAPAAVLIIVGNDDNVGAFKEPVIGRTPPANAAAICGRGIAELNSGVGVSFAFANQDALACFDRGN